MKDNKFEFTILNPSSLLSFIRFLIKPDLIRGLKQTVMKLILNVDNVNFVSKQHGKSGKKNMYKVSKIHSYLTNLAQCTTTVFRIIIPQIHIKQLLSTQTPSPPSLHTHTQTFSLFFLPNPLLCLSSSGYIISKVVHNFRKNLTVASFNYRKL